MMSSGSTPYFSVSSLNERSATCSLRSTGDGLRLLLVVVDASDDERGAEAARERHDFLEAIFAVFEVDRIDQRLARRALERLFDHAVIGRVDHQRHFYFFDFDFEKARDVGHLVAIGVLQAYVEDVRAAAHLHAADFGGFLELAFRDQPLELAAAEHVGPLADDHRARVVVDHQRLDSGDDRAPDASSALADACPRPHRPAARMCSGVVPQHPPTRLTHPFSAKRAILPASIAGVSL